MISDAQREKLMAVLQKGNARTGMMVGILSHIVGNHYTVVANEPAEALTPGDSFDLPETVCTLVCEQKKPVAFHSAISIGFDTHPAYAKFNIDAYIGAPVRKNGEFFGTINFSDVNERAEPFSDADIAFVEGLAREAEIILQSE